MMALAYYIGYKDNIQSYMIIIQFGGGLYYFISLYYGPKFKTLNQILFSIFIYNFFNSLILRLIFYEYYELPFGEAIDSYTYDALGIKFHDASFMKFLKYQQIGFNIDDYGYSSFIIFIYKIFGPSFGREILLLLNALFVTLSSYFFYQTLRTLNFSREKSQIGMIIWGFYPFLYVTTSVGLKETIFCSIIVVTLYYIIKFKQSRSIKNLILVLILIACTLFFRQAVSLMLLISFLISTISNRRNHKSILVYIALGSILIIIFGSFLLLKVTGISLEQVIATAQWRNEQMGSNISGNSIQIIASIFGPFPNFTRYVQYGIYHSVGLLFKDIMSIFCISGIYLILKKGEYKLFGICFYYLIGILMLIVGGVALDMRYAITFFPAFIILLMYGLDNLKSKLLIYSVDIITILIVIFYNIR